MRLRSATTAIALSAMALAAPAMLPAQVTTYITPPRKASVDTAKPKPPAAVAKARADSAARMSISDMKAWVDSAAGNNAPAVAVADTALVHVDTTKLPQQAASTPARPTTTFSNGAIAPNTATSLPTLLVLGAAMVTAGALLLLGLRQRRA